MARPVGTPQSDEWKAAQSERLKKQWADRKARAAQSKKVRKAWSDPAKRAAQSERMKKKAAEHPERYAKSEETRKKISETLTGKPHPHTKEQDRKISESLKGKVKSEKTRKKISAAKKGQTYRPRSEEHTRNQSEAQRDKPKSEHQRKNLSKAGKEYYSTPEGKQRATDHSEAMKKWHHENPDVSAKMIAAAQAVNPRWHDTKPELQMAAILDQLGITYKKQYRASWLPKGHRNHKWDFAIPDAQVFCCVDGCYWHGCKKHTTEARREQLKEKTQKELERDAAAECSDWYVLRFWEHDLNENPGGVARVVMQTMEHAYRVRVSA